MVVVVTYFSVQCLVSGGPVGCAAWADLIIIIIIIATTMFMVLSL